MSQMALVPKLSVFVFVLYFVTSAELKTDNQCFADTLICIDRIKEAGHHHPKYRNSLLCQMKIAFIEPNKESPAYTDCVNEARDTYAGPMKRGGTFNPTNSKNWVESLDKAEMRKALTKCVDKLSDCYDVNNLRLCLSRHEHL